MRLAVVLKVQGVGEQDGKQVMHVLFVTRVNVPRFRRHCRQSTSTFFRMDFVTVFTVSMVYGAKLPSPKPQITNSIT